MPVLLPVHQLYFFLFSQICIAQLVIRLTNIMFVFLILVKSSFCILAFILCVCMFVVPSFLILFEEIYLTIILSSLTIIFFILLFLQLYKPCNKLLRKGRRRVVKCVVLKMAMISSFFSFFSFRFKHERRLCSFLTPKRNFFIPLYSLRPSYLHNKIRHLALSGCKDVFRNVE